MRLCTYVIGRETTLRSGIVRGGQVYELTGASPAEGEPLKGLLASGIPLTEVATAADGIRLSDVRLRPPILKPDKFLCVGLNYASHAQEAGMEVTEVPTFFVKLPNAVIGPEEPIVIPHASHRIDWEGELAVVIGRVCAEVATADAMDYVAGYTITNDVTARDYQFKTSQWNLGKTFDGFAPTGPWLTTLDEIDQPDDLRLTTRLNGEVMQDARTSDLIFPVASLIAFFSTIMTLVPGDIIATGTPSGIGAMMRPRRWLHDGDVVSIEVEQVGVLTNTVRGPLA